jgi:hypothetical protein
VAEEPRPPRPNRPDRPDRPDRPAVKALPGKRIGHIKHPKPRPHDPDWENPADTVAAPLPEASESTEPETAAPDQPVGDPADGPPGHANGHEKQDREPRDQAREGRGNGRD